MTIGHEGGEQNIDTDSLLRERASQILSSKVLDTLLNVLPQLSLLKRAEAMMHIAALDELLHELTEDSIAGDTNEGTVVDFEQYAHRDVVPVPEDLLDAVQEEVVVDELPMAAMVDQDQVTERHEEEVAWKLPVSARRYLQPLVGRAATAMITADTKDTVSRTMADLHYDAIHHRSDMVPRSEYELRMSGLLEGLSYDEIASMLVECGIRERITGSAIGQFFAKTCKSIVAVHGSDHVRQTFEAALASKPEDTSGSEEEETITPAAPTLDELIDAAAAPSQSDSFRRLLSEQWYDDEMYEGQEWFKQCVQRYAPHTEAAQALFGEDFDRQVYHAVVQLAGIDAKQNDLPKTLRMLTHFGERKGITEHTMHTAIVRILEAASQDATIAPVTIVPEVAPVVETSQTSVAVETTTAPLRTEAATTHIMITTDLWQAAVHDKQVPVFEARRSIERVLEKGHTQGQLERKDVICIMDRLYEDKHFSLDSDQQTTLATLRRHYDNLSPEAKLQLQESPDSMKWFERFTSYSPAFGAPTIEKIAEEASRATSRKQRIRPTTVIKKIGGVLQVLYGEAE